MAVVRVLDQVRASAKVVEEVPPMYFSGMLVSQIAWRLVDFPAKVTVMSLPPVWRER